MIIDTHMHIFENKYDDIREDVIQEAFAYNVKKMIAVGYDYESSLKAIELANSYPEIYAAIGLHPSEVLKYLEKGNDLDLNWIYKLSKNPKVVAVGEIGLDYYWDKSFIPEQQEIFIKQIKIANDLNLPIICHCRDAINDCYNIMIENPTKGVMHCFGGSLEMAERFIKEGYYLGIGGVLTFKNSKEIKRVVSNISLDYLLSETDSPYLTPMPHRGELNHPGYVKYVVEAIALIKEESTEEVEKALERNAAKLFNI